jgi:hypothetical protein
VQQAIVAQQNKPRARKALARARKALARAMKVSFSAIEAVVEERAVRGSDLIVYLKGPAKTPVAVDVKERQSEADLRKSFGGDDAVVFLKNKNLQDFRRHYQGALVWTWMSPEESIIAVTIRASGEQAFVEILCPEERKGERVLLDTENLEGAYLQQVLGPPIMEFDQKRRPKAIDAKTNLIIPLTGMNGKVKMNVEGPDVGIPTSWVIPEKVKDKLGEDPFATRNSSKLPPNPDMGKPVPVVYIYRPSLEPEKYKFVKTFINDRTIVDDPEIFLHDENLTNTEMKSKPIFSVPIGAPKLVPGSSRYVCVI